MYKQTTITPDGQTRERTIDSEKLIDLLVQLHLLKQGGEDIEIHTNASMENSWTWDKITVIRINETGCITTIFDKMD